LQDYYAQRVDCPPVRSPCLKPFVEAHVRSSLITSSTNGYDGSMMNGLQSLPQWTGYFDNPSGGRLGLLNAIQVST
jgi:hypothetical protein